MEPTSLILAALVAGATAAAQDTASQAIKDAYSGLKALIQRCFAEKPEAEMILAKHEEKPDVWQAPLKDALEESGADQDEEIIRQAQQVMTLVNPQQASQGKYNIQIVEGKGIVIGDNAQVTQTFNDD